MGNGCSLLESRATFSFWLDNDNESGENRAFYRIGWDLDEDGAPERWSDDGEHALALEGSWGRESGGADLVMGELNGNGRPEFIQVWVDEKEGENQGYCRIGWDVNDTGHFHRYDTPPGVGDRYPLPPGSTRQWKAIDMFHKIGVPYEEHGWSVVSTGLGGSNDHALYGPYLSLNPGLYQATFYLKGDPYSGGATQATLDVYAGGDTLVSQDVTKSELSTTDWTPITLEFTLDSAKDLLEFRAHTKANVNLYMDRVELQHVHTPALAVGESRTWQATELQHEIGQQIGDTDWQAAGPDGDNYGHTLHGPHVDLGPGVYDVTFHLKIDSTTSTGSYRIQNMTDEEMKIPCWGTIPANGELELGDRVACLDVTADDGQTILASQAISRTHFQADDAWQEFAYRLYLVKPQSRVEMRVWTAGNATLTTDWVRLESQAEASYPVGVPFTWRAAKLNHTVGYRTPFDTWGASPFTPPGMMVWGPYVDLVPGRYFVTFRLKAAGVSEGEVATLDVSRDSGQVIVQETINVLDFFAGGELQHQWHDFTLTFDLSQPAQDVEFRIYFEGNAHLEVDQIQMVRYESYGAGADVEDSELQVEGGEISYDEDTNTYYVPITPDNYAQGTLALSASGKVINRGSARDTFTVRVGGFYRARPEGSYWQQFTLDPDQEASFNYQGTVTYGQLLERLRFNFLGYQESPSWQGAPGHPFDPLHEPYGWLWAYRIEQGTTVSQPYVLIPNDLPYSDYFDMDVVVDSEHDPMQYTYYFLYRVNFEANPQEFSHQVSFQSINAPQDFLDTFDDLPGEAIDIESLEALRGLSWQPIPAEWNGSVELEADGRYHLRFDVSDGTSPGLYGGLLKLETTLPEYGNAVDQDLHLVLVEVVSGSPPVEEEQAVSLDLTEPDAVTWRYQPTEDGEVQLRLDITSYQGIYHVILGYGDDSLWGYSTVMETRQPPFTVESNPFSVSAGEVYVISFYPGEGGDPPPPDWEEPQIAGAFTISPSAPNQLVEGTPVNVDVSMGPGVQYTIVVPRNGDMRVELADISGDMMGISLVVRDESYVSMYFASPQGDNMLVADVPGVNEGQVYLVEMMSTMGSASGALSFDIR